ncbi:MAG: heavy-metal-associated domain-containing protein [bacterium]
MAGQVQNASAVSNAWEVRRRIKVPSLSSGNQSRMVESVLLAINGVHEVVTNPERYRIMVRYDASQVGFSDIAMALTEMGFTPASDWWSRKKADWFCYMDDNAKSNARHPAGPCCNRAPRGTRRK